MATENTSQFMQKAGDYGLQELLEIMDELSQESTKKGLLTRQQKELSTLGIALYKSCHRCISIHSAEAKRLEASELQFCHVKKVLFFMIATPHGDSEL